jgi:flagellar biosynthesis/type III secretory pathway protein FliH
MEVERVQDGPLKTTEISRFLEASKTSYRAVDNILTDKKETRFQQRTLTEIATETETRNNASKLDHSIEPSDLTNTELETPEELEAKELNQQLIADKEQESLKLLKEKEKEDARLIQEKKDQETYDKGLADGKAAAELEGKKSLENGLLALENARKSILDLNASHFIKLRDQIASQILNLSSERAGIEISQLPDIFLNKIEGLLETIGKATEAPIVFLNVDDLDAISTFIEAQGNPQGFTFKPHGDLMRGDIVIEIGSISIKDTARERSGIIKKHDTSSILQESDKITSEVTNEVNVSDQTDQENDP